MGKSKKKQQDFQKVKFKVGKTLKKAENVTNASFKTRTIQITQQLKTDSDQPSTTRKLNIQDLLVHCQHFSSSFRHDGVTGLRELLASHPELMISHLAAILEKTSELFTDKDPVVRKAVIKLIRVFYSKISMKQIAPFFPLLKAHLCCAMTHIYDDIQVDSLHILDILLEFYPSLVINKSSELFSNFIEQISRRPSEKDKSSRTLVSNPSSKMSTSKWRTSVLERLHKFLAEIFKSHRKNEKEQQDSSGHFEREREMVWSKLDSPGYQPFPTMFSYMWDNSTFTLRQSRSQVKEIPGRDRMGSGLEIQELVELAHTLVPLLLQCWAEAVIGHGQQTSQGTDNLLRSDNISQVSSVLLVIQLLLDCIHSDSIQSDISWLSKEYLKEFRQHFMIYFPYSVHYTLVGKDKKDKNTKVTAEWINLSICDIMTKIIPSSSHDGIPSWLSDIMRYIKEFLHGKYYPHAVGQHAELVSKIVTCLIRMGKSCGDELKELVASLFHRYKGAHFSSVERRVYLKFFADVTSSSDYNELMKDRSEIEAAFFASLPELLPLVVGNHSLSALIVKVMKRQACQHCKSLLAAVYKSFHILYGEMLVIGLGQSEQKEFVSLLYYMPDISEDCHRVLVNFCWSQVIPEHLALYMIQVIQNRFLRVDFKEKLSDPVKIGQHISFLMTLLLGVSSQDLEKSDVIHGDHSRGICGMEVHLGQINMDSWSRHQKIVEAVMQSFQQCPVQMLDIVEQFIKDLLDQAVMHTLPAVSAFGILCFVTKIYPISLKPQEDNIHFIKLCIATMHFVISTDSSASDKLSYILESILHLSQNVLLILNGGMQRICEVLLFSAKDKIEEEHLSVLIKMAKSLLLDEERRSALQDKQCVRFLSQLFEHVQAHLSNGTERQWFAEFHYLLSLIT